eukprot:gnl/TRDRNA2_/TRDRNA2_168561_c1_seq4.p1 gnl/TRDRNA2_/TRDRNA2_168561_c1~~gnl/TRDRNA2_/TRDRNA2_168561_c1_seq4.p1  ORF type:complete len:220 (+),score=1.82 gnl/TRDRNA2_/TRDRNA2_168561_c1_seq4:35-661(+)
MVAYDVAHLMRSSPFNIGRFDALNSSRNHWRSLCDRFSSLKDYSYARREADLLGMQEYASDIQRFKDVLSRLTSASAHAAKRPLLIWKYSTPQHFPTPTGMWQREGMPGQQSFESVNCRPLEHRTKAYARNTLAEHLLETLFADGSLILMKRSWNSLRNYHDLHLANGDCTHWCLNSVVPKFWARDLVQVIQKHTKGRTSNGSARTIP